MEIVPECIAVGRAAGAKLEGGVGKRMLASYRAGAQDTINSVLIDGMADGD